MKLQISETRYYIQARRPRFCRQHPDLDTIMRVAQEVARKQQDSHPVAVWDALRQVVIAIVTDDANGLTVHKLPTYPENG